LLIGAGLAFALLGACGGGSSSTKEGVTPSPAATAASGPGTIVLKSTTIRGQSGRVLLVFAMQDGKQGNLARACIRIDSDTFTISGTPLSDIPTGNDPCGGSTPTTRLPEGRYTLIAGVYAPPAQAPERQVSMTVDVKGNVEVALRGEDLSR
jgi:hypothetical protein